MKLFWVVLGLALLSCKGENKVRSVIVDEAELGLYQDAHRPQFHFTPAEKWMNDPNGLVYNQGVYHLFYQYYPEDIVWGPMHWGHAISKDMVYWENKPIALFPDEHGYIFSGSAVVDTDNSSGLGSLGNPPLVAVFTYHDPVGEKAGKDDFQTQGIAYSLDNGETWSKYEGNPVIENEGIRDFRDPKVFWNHKTGNWTMLLVAGDHLQIWQSPDLKDWEKVSEFGKEQGAHGGVWECPDLFPLKVEGTDLEKWVLLISINPGAPNGGSGTQYFVGDFDGRVFTSDQKEHKWIDWGADNYAGVTYNNAPNNDRIFIGWMSNWAYAQETPTEKWRSAMTLPRKLSLHQINDGFQLFNYPLQSVDKIRDSGTQVDIFIDAQSDKSLTFDHFNSSEVKFKTSSKAFRLDFQNSLGENFNVILDAENQQFILDRSRSGKVDFDGDFAQNVQTMPIPDMPSEDYEVRILMDWSSVEIFINGGQYVMTSQIFPNEFYRTLMISNPTDMELELDEFTISPLKSIW